MRPLTFVLASTPITAHTINVAPVAARLVERGHRVLWYAASRFHAQVAAAGAEPYAFGEAREFDDLAAAYGGAGSLRAIAGLRQGFAEQLVGDAARRVRDLEALSDGAGVDAVLVDAMFVAARLWHERGGPVWASLGDGPLTYADVDTPPYGAGLLPDGRPRGSTAQPRDDPSGGSADLEPRARAAGGAPLRAGSGPEWSVRAGGGEVAVPPSAGV